MSRGEGFVRNILFPKTCVFCGSLIIDPADSSARYLLTILSICPGCLSHLPFKTFDTHEMPCLSNPYEGDPISDFTVLVPFRYEGEIVSALRALKFHDAPYIAETLAFFMAESARRTEYLFDAVIPIPLSAARLRKRGYNQAALLARAIARHVDLPCPENFLLRTRNTKQQSRYHDPAMRAVNVHGSFAVPDDVSVDSLSVLLVDDVFTTGNTLHEAARALYRAGVAQVVAITAATGRRENDGKGFMTIKLSNMSTHR